MSRTPLTGRHKLQSKTKELLEWLEAQAPFESTSGLAGTEAYNAAVGAGVYTASQQAFAMVLGNLEQRGLVEREKRGRRCYRLAATHPTTPPQIAPAEPEPVDVATVQPDDETTGGVHLAAPGDEPPPLAERTPLVGSVHLSLDLDPTMARLVLDLVERGNGTTPVDRHDVGLMIEQAANRATMRSAEGMARHDARLTELEETMRTVQAGMRGLGVAAVSPNGKKHRPVKPDFRALGVKDSAQRKLLTDLAMDGWTLVKKPNGHIGASKDGCKPLELSSTPGDHRTTLNDRSRARTAGAAI